MSIHQKASFTGLFYCYKKDKKNIFLIKFLIDNSKKANKLIANDNSYH